MDLEGKWRLEEYLEGVATRVREGSEVPIRHNVIKGLVPQSLEDHVRESAPQLVVMSTHGRGPLSRAWLGSVTDHLMRHVSPPVLCVRPQDGVTPDLSRQVRFDRIVSAVDGSEQSERCLAWCAKLAKATSAELTVVRVIPPAPLIQSIYLPDAVFEMKQFIEDERKAAERYLSEVVVRLTDDGMTATGRVPVGYQPAMGILKAAEDDSADLIAVGTHGRSGLARVALGSVADKVVRGASLPVLVTRC
ncbi:MAG: universal stress protein, partial [Gemmatimonadales bacterium]